MDFVLSANELATPGNKALYVRITSPDALLVVVGERNALNYSTQLPDLRQGIHFCLFDNLWGTNFSMWWGGDMRYRFRAEWIGEAECSEKP